MHAAIRGAGDARPRGSDAALGPGEHRLRAGRAVGGQAAVCRHPRLREAAGSQADVAATVAQDLAARGYAQRAVDDDLSAADRARSDAPLRDGRAGRHGQRGSGRVPANTGPRRFGERVRE